MSRKISDLEPDVAAMCTAHIEACREADIILLVYCTRRTLKEQALYYAKGRRFDELPDDVAVLIADEIRKWQDQGYFYGPGNIVTRTMQSKHLEGIAYDCVGMHGDLAQWNDDALWEKIGALGEQCGLEWGGRWENFQDKPHFQRPLK